MSSQPFMVNPRQVVRPLVFALLLSVFFAASASVAYGQFTLSVSSPLSPSAVDPGGTATATLDIEPNGSNAPVTITCVVTASNQQTVSLPTCEPSPTTPITPPAMPSLTVETLTVPPVPPVPPGLYNITVTGTDGSTSQTIALALNVVNVTQDYTLSVSPTTATPSPVKAGAKAITTVTVTPIASYTGNVTLACLTVTPVVALAPVCSFNPPTVMVTSSSLPPRSILTITTTGPAPTVRLWNQRSFYALWLAIPGLALVGVCAAGTRRKHVLGALSLMAMASSLLLLPACGSSKSTSSTSGTVTPANTYTFTLTGADANGAAPSSTTATTVTLAVD